MGHLHLFVAAAGFKALTGKNSTRLQDRAHALKGCSLSLGAVKLSSLCDDLEHMAAAGGLLEANAIVDQLENEAAVVIGELHFQTSR